MKVYRPRIDGDDPTMYFQRLSGDRRRGIVIPKRPAPGKVTIRPKGLLPNERYLVTFQESPAEAAHSGAELMERGVTIERMLPGELIYLNLPMHPGSKRDREPPTPPTAVVKRRGENMGYPGIELQWQPGTDNNWISYYQIVRNGQPIDKLAKFCSPLPLAGEGQGVRGVREVRAFYFDHSAGADQAARYEIRSVDGAGNHSPPATADGPAAKPSTVFDDVDAGLKYTGQWRRQNNLQPAHAGTLSSSQEAGATLAVACQGKRILWFSKLGEDCGQAEARIDGGAVETVDTYCSDDVWGVCVFRKDLPTPGPHTLRITIPARHSARSKGNWIHVDGIRVEQE